jgi:hypothetical protein
LDGSPTPATDLDEDHVQGIHLGNRPPDTIRRP